MCIRDRLGPCAFALGAAHHTRSHRPVSAERYRACAVRISVSECQEPRLTNRADLPTKLASVHELRSTNDPHSMKQADLLTSGLSANGNDTLLDIGRTHPLIDTNLNDQSLGNRAYAADKYAASKDRRYRRIINDNNLPYGYKSLCMDLSLIHI